LKSKKIKISRVCNPDENSQYEKSVLYTSNVLMPLLSVKIFIFL